MVDTCTRDNSAPNDVLDELPYSQAQSGRHLCAICAYQRGRTDAENGIPRPKLGHGERCDHGSVVPDHIFDNLHEYQGGRGRHKCIYCAYAAGYASVIAPGE